MHISINFLLLIIALIHFILGAISLPTGRYNLVAGGLAFWLLSLIII